MFEFIQPWLRFEIGWILRLQEFDSFVPAMRLFTDFGYRSIPYVIICVLYFVSWRKGIALGCVYFLSKHLIVILKVAMGLPRPYWIDDRVVVLAGYGGFGMPSGHVLIPGCIWLGTACLFRKARITWTAVGADLADGFFQSLSWRSFCSRRRGCSGPRVVGGSDVEG